MNNIIPHLGHSSWMLGIELFYTLIIIILCFVIYYKTEEMYNLTKYNGIKYFRYAFLFFGLSYLSRIFIHLIKLSIFAFDFIIPHQFVFPIFMIPVGYFSTMAILFLTYSLIWKKFKFNKFIKIANILAIVISISAFMYHTPFILSFIQLPLIFILLYILLKKHSNKKKNNTLTLYFLIAIFWIISLFTVGPKRLIPFQVIITLKLISIVIFVTIYNKVSKWIK